MRTFPAGRDLKAARKKKKILEGQNQTRDDFDSGKTQNITLSRWGDIYLNTYAREKKSRWDDARHIEHLCRTLGGNLLLSQISRAHVEQFKQIRKAETHREKPISETTIGILFEMCTMIAASRRRSDAGFVG